MKINITELIKGNEKKFDFKFNYQIKPIDYIQDITSSVVPIFLSGSIFIVDDEIYMHANMEGIAEFQCNRCLKKVQKQITADINEELIKEDAKDFEADDCFIIRNNEIDISKIIENVFILSLPMKILCNKACKGLCPNCGVDLNVEQCNCKDDVIDPRLAKLKDLL